MTSAKRLFEVAFGQPQCPGDTAQIIGSAALKRCKLKCGGPNIVDYFRESPQGGEPLHEQQLFCGMQERIVVDEGDITGVRTNDRGQVRLIVAQGRLGDYALSLPYFFDAPDALPNSVQVVNTDGQPAQLPGAESAA